MKHLKSSLRDLRRIFEQSITLRDIAEPFTSFDAARTTEEVAEFIRAKDYDVVGVRKEGLTAGYVLSSALTGGSLHDHMAPFDNEALLPENASLLKAFEAAVISGAPVLKKDG